MRAVGDIGSPLARPDDVPDRPPRRGRDGRPRRRSSPSATSPPAPSRRSRPSAPPRRCRSTSGPRTSRRSCCGSRAGRAARWPSRSSARAARTASSTRSTARSSAVAWDSEQPEQLWIGHRDRPNELLLRNPALMNELGAAAARLPGGHVEGFADTFGALFMAIYADVLAGRPSASPRYPTFADGHDEMLVGRRGRRERSHRRLGDVVRDPARSPRPPALPDEPGAPRRRRLASMKLGLPDRPVPGDAADGRRRLGRRRRLRGPRDRLLAAGRPARPAATPARATSTSPTCPTRQATEIVDEIDGQGPLDLRPRLLPQPAPPGPRAPGAGHRPPQAGHRRRREDGRPAREHVHGRRRREEPGPELGGGAPGLARHRRLRERPRA